MPACLSSPWIVLELFVLIPKWRKTCMIPDPAEIFHWTDSHLSIVHHYFSRMHTWCHFRELPSIELFDRALHNGMFESSTNYYTQVAATFSQELHEFFMVPRLQKYAVLDYGVKKYQVVDVFISFLLQLLCNRTDSIGPLKDRVDNLDKELRFLHTVLGDASLQQQLGDEHDVQVYNLLEEFEAVANEAGSLVHSLFFSTDHPVSKKMEEGLGVVLKRINLLKANIMKFLDLLPLCSGAMTPKISLDALLIVDSLVHDLEVLIKREDNPIADVRGQIVMLHQGLVTLQASVKDIGGPRSSEIGELKELLMRMRDIACEAEYSIISFLVGDVPPAYLIIRLTNVVHKIEQLLGTELQEIKEKYADIGSLKVANRFSALLPSQVERNYKVNAVTIGLEEKEIHILEHLLGGTKHLQIISITGMPGLGKTTFAKKLYNHSSIKHRFDRCSFCVVSQSYQKRSVLLDILINPTGAISEVGEESLVAEEILLVEHLYKSLKGRRYFIVMDDMWESAVWDDLKQCFPDDENGSRILITSRNKDVAPHNAIIYELPSLTNDECWDLLEKKVFHNEPCPPELIGVGKKIAVSCCGVPLAVVAVAGVLSAMDKEESQWENVEQNLASFIFDGGDDTVMQILGLSYQHLPQHLKRCFLYFKTFLKNREIPVQELMRLWIAEGFIIMHKEQKKSAENVAEEYLMELIDKNIATVSRRRSNGGAKACILHDLLRDLCLRKCEEENFMRLTSATVLSNSDGVNSLLSPFISLNLHSFHANATPSVNATNMKVLRVLSFNRTLNESSQFFGIEFLVSLRFLSITKLPASIGSLVNLEFLVVKTSKHKVVIPSVILKMMRLRYLKVFRDATYDADCNSSSHRNNLEFLSTVNICNLRDEERLKTSPHLRKLKCICEAFWDQELGAYRYPDLCFLTQLESLNVKVRFEGKTGEFNFPPCIKKLTLICLGSPGQKIVKAVGRLPKLEVLKLVSAGCSSNNETWETSDGEFQHLKFLKLQSVSISQWNVASSQHFPRLQQLILINCSHLQKIPSEIGEIASLQFIEVQEECQKSLVESAENIQQEQREMGNEELRVYHYVTT